MASARATPPGVAEIRDRDELARRWRRLEARARGSFFQSWIWSGCWLASLPPEITPRALCVSAGGETLALALLHRRRRRRHRVLNATGLFVGEVGDPRYDALTLEHGGPLARADRLAEAFERLLVHLLAERGWDELYLSGIDADSERVYRDAAARHRLDVRLVDQKPYFYVDLAALRARGRSYLETRSANTRYQIRRAMRAYGAAGGLRLSAAASTDEAQHFMTRLIALHQPYWRRRNQPGAFASEFLRGFHRRLIETGHPRGGIQLLRVSAGGDEIGYLYNFVHGDTVYCYQSGFDYPADAKLKPGLVSHTLAVDHCLDAGYARYDFLAGDTRYKRSLCTHRGDMRWIVLQRRRLRFRLENAARRCRDAARARA